MARDRVQPCRARRPGSDALAGPEASRSATSSAAAGETADSRRSRSRALPASSSVAAGLGQRNSGGAQQRPRITRGEVDDRRQRVVGELPVGYASADERARLIVRQVRQHHFDVEERVRRRAQQGGSVAVGARHCPADRQLPQLVAQRAEQAVRRAGHGVVEQRHRRQHVRGGREEALQRPVVCSVESSAAPRAVAVHESRRHDVDELLRRQRRTSVDPERSNPLLPQLPRYLAQHRGPT